MTNLLVDIGNTRVKWAIYSVNRLVEQGIDTSPSIPWQSIHSAILCRTGSLKHPLVEKIISHVPSTLILDHNTNLPFNNLYNSPKTLGPDRMALIAGAQTSYPDTACLVIDAGTCVTYDFITEKGDYLGGNITPGLQMRLNAMHEMTTSLPLVKPAYHPNPLGQNTTQALQNGTTLGLVDEIDGMILRLKQPYNNFKTILTGGSAYYLSKYIKNDIFVHPDLLMKGLLKILRLNAV